MKSDWWGDDVAFDNTFLKLNTFGFLFYIFFSNTNHKL